MYNVRVGDKVWVDGQPAFSVKGGGNRFDVYTMKEMIAAFYGENCKCIIIKQSGRKKDNRSDKSYPQCEISRSRMVWVCHFASAYFLPQKKWMTNEKTDETDEKYKHNI